MSTSKGRIGSDRKTTNPSQDNDVNEVKKEVKEVKENLLQVTKDVSEVKTMMSQMLEKLNMLELLNNLPSPTEGILNIIREEILIAGGHGPLVNVEKSTEIYSWEKKRWHEMNDMNDGHSGATSFLYGQQLFVLGGNSKIIETLDLNKIALGWMKSGNLPYECGYHQTVVHEQRIIHIGGYNFTKKEMYNKIDQMEFDQMEFSPPSAIIKECQLPGPRDSHGTEIFGDKVLILGGKDVKNISIDSVLKFDVIMNEHKKMPPLPHALSEMATVRWRDQVVVLGGINEKEEVLNDVFTYDCKTGKITTLPSMLEKRCRCCAVITGNTIAVMGGRNAENNILDSVECFTMGGSTWEHLSAMNKARYYATAHVLPSTRKYV